jgi:general stress protein 26
MRTDDPAARDILRRSMVARIATLSRNKRPSITPIYFVFVNGHIWLGTSDWTLAARDVKADPRVSLLFEVERHRDDDRILRITGKAIVRTDRQIQRSYNLRVAFKYSLTPNGIRHNLAHVKLLPLMHRYHAQSAEKGQACVIDVTPEQVEFLNDPQAKMGQRKS